jgi:hypothetical protein
MKPIALFLFLFGSLTFANGQSESLNQFDSAGRKNGKWIMYYDKYCSVVKDSQKASYYCYVHYIHGRKNITESDWGGKNLKLVDSLFSQQTGRVKLLDGKYTWYNEKGLPVYIHYYNKGELVYRKWFYSSGKLRIYMDYTKECDGQPHSGYIYEYDENGNLRSKSPLHIFKGKNGKYYGGAI